MHQTMGLAAVLVLSLGASAANAQSLDGWCFPGDGCTGEVPITGNGFFTCEEICTMSNPGSVRGMDATLYDVQCSGDQETYELRMLFSRYADAQGRDRIVVLSSRGPHLEDEGAIELRKCL